MLDLQSGQDQLVPLSRADLEVCLGELSHELKNLLNSVVLTLQVAERKPNPQVLSQSKRHITLHSKEILLLIENLRDLSRLSHEDGEFRIDNADLLDSVTEAVVQAREMAEPLRIDVCHHIRQHPSRIAIDRLRLTRILFSVLLELIEQVSSGGQINLTVEKESSFAIIRIAAESGAKLNFQWPDQHGDHDGKLHRRLRLPIAKALVQRHGGDAGCETSESGAVAAVIRLPLAADNL